MNTTLDRDEHNDPRLTVTLVGVHDIFRFTVNWLDDQSEFYNAAREVLTKLRNEMGHNRFDAMASSLLGEHRHQKLAYCFQADGTEG